MAQWTIVKSETFIFGVLLVFVTIALPWLVEGSWSKPHLAESTISSVKHPNAAPTPYLHQLLHLLPFTLRYRNFITSIPGKLFMEALTPISFAFNILATIIAPGLILIDVCFDIFVRRPWGFATWVLHLLYPIYIFLGTAVLVGAGLGTVGVLAGWLGVYWSRAGNEDEGPPKVSSESKKVLPPKLTREKAKGKQLKSVVFAD